ncbi:homoserine kinase [Liquorilactobacillus hordei]|uniref:Homoserine kinase n=1 Tax=Liquorilactobacillus hordei DSM 19519 TaxID=1423759 RepID=A0A0R1MFU6_9LACO|nr:homoserine kinase [Liquorilactobacillus hordei]KRL06828.1 homoserine kinase [Liquorilactobacillus hordei DSM 19519]QYH51507.1 homoserine kinase [Liquorilactobacillus hordei DSM 19519]
MQFEFRVPATSANLGPGFDSIGVAVNLYLTVKVLGESNSWVVEHNMGKVYHDERNLIISTALKVVPTLKPHKVVVSSDIPLARGLGSSSSAIVAGIEIADKIANLKLTKQQKLEIATKFEGHPDNVAPAIFGNLVVSSYDGNSVTSIVAKLPRVEFVAYVPNKSLLTKESRGVLPELLPFKTAIEGSAVANTLVAALMMGDLDKAGKMIESDRFHEHYREKLVPYLKDIREAAHLLGVYGTYLSGAGPTVMMIVQEKFAARVAKQLSTRFTDGKFLVMKVDEVGCREE